MSDYKNYLCRAMGVKESRIKPSDIDRDEFPGIDPDELVAGANDEAGEHGMPKSDAIQTAVQHLEAPDQAHYYSGLEKAKDKGMLRDMMSLSPTAIPTPVIGVAVRGSTTGGLPSGVDQGADISPTCLGGYDKVSINPVNSKLVNKTPSNINMKQFITPIVTNPTTTGAVTHPFQIQKDAGDEPQAVTGASTDSDDTLTLKSAAPKGIDIDVAEEGYEEEEENKSSDGGNNPNKEEGMGIGLTEGKHKPGCKCGFCMNKGKFGKKKEAEEGKEEEQDEKEGVDETFERHKKLMFEKHPIDVDFKTGEKEKVPVRKKLDVDFKTGEKEEVPIKPEKVNEVGASEPFTTKWKMNKEKAGMVKLSEAFDRMNTLAGLSPVKEEPQKVKENTKYTAPFERMRGLANIGENVMMADGTWKNLAEENDNTNEHIFISGDSSNVDGRGLGRGLGCRANRGFGIQNEEEKWMQDASKSSTKGALHKDLGVPEDKKIPTERLESLKKMLHQKSERGTLSDKELKLFRRVNAALNMRNANK